ncbi:MAG: CRISPR-associated endonuclease Cas2 [Candidatus Cryptobacteroides sp.]|jgi:CRISPR-associated protein Cas2
MLIVSYDIENDKVRTRFMKMLLKNGGVRLQFSVYEINNTRRVVENIIAKINTFSSKFTNDDSVVIFNVDNHSVRKFGNAIHRDKDVLYF